MMKRFAQLLVTVSLSLACLTSSQAEDTGKKSLRVLLIAGGCCHDYESQTKLLKSGIESRINAEVTVILNPEKGTDTRFDVYESADWADGYDVVLHDECSASVTDVAYVGRILDAHQQGVPAVNLHCAMHCYRWGNFREPVKLGADNAGWYEMIGLQSSGHGPQSPLDVSYADGGHPITQGLSSWKTINEELYNNLQVFDTAEVLATASQIQKPRKRELKQNPNAKAKRAEAGVVWTNLYGPNKTRTFSTSLGHNNETVGDDRYLDLVVRGLLWTSHHLNEDGTPEYAYAK